MKEQDVVNTNMQHTNMLGVFGKYVEACCWYVRNCILLVCKKILDILFPDLYNDLACIGMRAGILCFPGRMRFAFLQKFYYINRR